MTLAKIFQQLTEAEEQDLDAMRSWIKSIATENQTLTVAGNLNLIADQIVNGSVTARDAWKLASLGLLFGDALHQSYEGRLHWVMVEDDYGLSPALRWKQTDYLIFPISSLRERVQSGEAFDIQTLLAQCIDLFPFRSR